MNTFAQIKATIDVLPLEQKINARYILVRLKKKHKEIVKITSERYVIVQDENTAALDLSVHTTGWGAAA